MKRSLVLAAALAAALPFSALAHKAWLQPSQTVIAGEKPWITVDAAVSNDLFYFNHVPLRLDSLVITAPDGTIVQPQNASTGKFRSVFDVELTQQGTYRLASVSTGLSATWEENGAPKRWRGTPATFANEVPKKAKKLEVAQSVNRIETFVTNGTPNATALKPTKQGIEMIALGHPNDLVAGEPARFRVLVDGKPRAGLEFEITRGGTRYRNAQDEIKVTSDKKGEFSITWPEAGMYWLETSSEDKKASLKQAKKRRLNYVATLEVLPQ
ncbi:DUF4198 domain-containing protein [Stenotrophomonas rhizophila]|uniref:DUF4198 domain-containing protein n=1 Tax=Stenotrophomonas nematodicola TaxID=2656746 RepID=A0ABW7CUD9_9GAMM|nr:DUF4198 domain-containing protein [Stenotrophomonas sp. BIGb0135]MCS4233823.1 putative GH25 family protein [Stenotrophomonas sp. BIGb0135]